MERWLGGRGSEGVYVDVYCAVVGSADGWVGGRSWEGQDLCGWGERDGLSMERGHRGWSVDNWGRGRSVNGEGEGGVWVWRSEDGLWTVGE